MNELTMLFPPAEPDGEPPLPPEFVEQTYARARRSVRRRRAVAGATAALAAVLAVVLLLPWTGRLPPPAPPAQPTNPPTLPEQFASYSAFTSSAVDQAAGRAIALYEYGSSELFTSWQTLVVGADRDTYRRVDRPENSAPPVLLSPDGTSVLYYEPTNEFTLLDLATGRTRTMSSVAWTSNIGADLQMLAWSPDGRFVAYAVPDPPPADGRASSSTADGEPIRHLVMLDVVAGTSIRYPDVKPITAAAFGPDSRQLAARLVGGSWIMSTQGERIRPWNMPAGITHRAGLTWSPDGALLTVIRPELVPLDPAVVGYTGYQTENWVQFVDMTGTGRKVPDDLPYDAVLGWRSPTSIIVSTWLSETDESAILEVSIVDGRSATLSRFSRAQVCEYFTQRCSPNRIQLATELVREAGIRPSDPDRGPRDTAARALAVALPTLLLAGIAWWVMGRRARRIASGRTG